MLLGNFTNLKSYEIFALGDHQRRAAFLSDIAKRYGVMGGVCNHQGCARNCPDHALTPAVERQSAKSGFSQRISLGLFQLILDLLPGHADVLAPKGANRDQIQARRTTVIAQTAVKRRVAIMRTTSGIAFGSSDIAPIRALPCDRKTIDRTIAMEINLPTLLRNSVLPYAPNIRRQPLTIDIRAKSGRSRAGAKAGSMLQKGRSKPGDHEDDDDGN
jgi:hypothetical protein